MKFEGGFQGRTNKLVDGCYSFWCGAIMPIVQAIICKKGEFGLKKYYSTIFRIMFHLIVFCFYKFRTVLKLYTQETGV